MTVGEARIADGGKDESYITFANEDHLLNNAVPQQARTVQENNERLFFQKLILTSEAARTPLQSLSTDAQNCSAISMPRRVGLKSAERTGV
jgi:hypothetical protein